MDKDTGITSRIVGVLRAFADGESVMGVKQLAERLELPQSTVHRLLDQLVELGMIERAPHRRYRIGTEFFRMGCRVESKFRLIELARPVMQRVVDQVGETCSLSIYAPTARQRLMLAKIDNPDHPLRYTQPMLENRALGFGAAGRAILAHLPAADIERIYAESPKTSPTHKPLPPYDALLRDLEKIRTAGYAFASGELLSLDTAAVAAPFFGQQRRVMGALCVIVPTARFNERLFELIISCLISAVGQMTMLSGGRRLPVPAGRGWSSQPGSLVRHWEPTPSSLTRL
jgi:DNA-binding IclR family transcriptional regulator